MEKNCNGKLIEAGLTWLCRVNLTEDGRDALLKLSRGDMRRALNVLQVRFPSTLSLSLSVTCEELEKSQLRINPFTRHVTQRTI